jgi:DNA-binding HxlR family transcriptional regulator
MDDLELQTLRDSILEAAQKMPRGISTAMLARLLKAMTFDLPETGPDSLDAQLCYLKDKGLIKNPTKAHTPSAELWQLTAEGDDHLRTK